MLTVGEPAGVGPDCILRAFRDHPEEFTDILVISPPDWLRKRAGETGLDIDVQELSSPDERAGEGALSCWPAGLNTRHSIVCGQPVEDTAHSVIQCIRIAAERCLAGKARAMITGPIEKAVLRHAGFPFPGHTEFLADLTGSRQVVMMLASDELRVALLTTHLALSKAPKQLTIEKTVACLRIVHQELRDRFGIAHPRLGLCGLNPHAGERGHFGREEIDILQPAAKLARNEGVAVDGPLPADTMFSSDRRRGFDAIVCCYHDQALIPIKALSFSQAVNITLGLPFVRTSPDHGTGLDRAGSPQVSYSSLMAAIRMARSMSKGSVDLISTSQEDVS